MTIASPETLEYLRNRTPEQEAADRLKFEQMTQGTELGKKLEEQFGGNSIHPSPGYGGGWGRHFDREGNAIPESGGIPGQSTTMMGRNPDGTPITFPGVGGSPGDIAREEAQDRINNPHLWGQQQAPRPEGFQRVATGIADWLTGNNWDFDQRGTGAKFLNEITKVGKDPNGNTFSDHVPNMKPVPPIDPLKVLGQSPTFGGEQTDPRIMQGPAPGQGTGGALGGAAQQVDPAGRYNPFEGQTITLPDGRVVPRTPENSVPGP